MSERHAIMSTLLAVRVSRFQLLMHNYIALFYNCSNDHVGFAISISSRSFAVTLLWMLAQNRLTVPVAFSWVSCVSQLHLKECRSWGPGIENRFTPGDLDWGKSHH